MATNGPNASKAQRREAARAQALALKAKQEAADKRARRITLGVLGVVLLALVVVVVALFVRDRHVDASDQVVDIPLSEVADVPETAREDGGFVLGADRAPGAEETPGVPEVGIYLDYRCSHCGEFEAANEATLEAFLTDGTANVVLYPLGFLDGSTHSTGFSTRAAAAAAWVASRAPEHFFDFHTALFESAAQSGGADSSNAEIADVAKQAGVPDDVASGISSGDARSTYGQWVYSATERAKGNPALANAEGNFRGTPTITIDGTVWEGNWADPVNLRNAVADADA